MKNILMAIMAAFAVVFSGCKQVPSVETMEATATAVGKAAGYVVNQTKIDDKSRTVVIEIVTKAAEVTPAKDQTFVDAWTPIAKEITDKLIADGKVDRGQALIINGAFGVVCKGIDYLLAVRYPKAKETQNLVSAAVKGFTTGFLAVFKPVNGAVSATASGDYDKEAYEYLMASEALGK